MIKIQNKKQKNQYRVNKSTGYKIMIIYKLTNRSHLVKQQNTYQL